MLFLLRRVSWPYFRRHWVITLLTAAGVALGVGVYIAIELSASSLRTSMRETVDRIAGKAALEVTAGEAGLPEDRVETVRSVPGVAAAQPIVEAVVKARGMEEASLMVLGIDLLGDRSVREWDFSDEEVLDDPLIFLAQPDSICLTEELARRHGLRIDDRIALETGQGYREFTVRGLVKARGAATAFGGNIALMDLYAAQYMFSRGRKVDRIDVVLAPDTGLDEARRRIASALGDGYDVDSPARRGAQMEVLISNYGMMMSLTSWQAVFIAVFLIFNVFAVAAARRRREIGILRSLGVTRGRILRLFLAEGAIVGASGAIVGVGAGLALAGVTTRFVVRLTEAAYGMTHGVPVVIVEPRTLAAGVLLGVASAVAAAFFPALGAARLHPVEALARGRFQRFSEGQKRARIAAGAASLAACVVVVVALSSRSLAWAVIGLLLINLPALFFAPVLIRLLVRAARPVLERLFGPEGRIAADALLQAPRRTSATVMALMVSVAFVINMAGLSGSYVASYHAWLDGVINADLYVSATERFFSKSYHLPAEFEGIVARLPGVRWVEPFRGIHIAYGGNTPILASIPLGKTYRRLDPRIVRGDRAAVLERAPRGEGFVVSENFSRLFGVRPGDVLTLPSPTGPVGLPVLGTLLDYTSDHGTVWVDRSVYVARWKDEGIDMLEVLLEKDADRTAVAAAIRGALSSRTNRLFVMTNADFKRTVSRLLDQFFSLSYIQLLIALLVAMLGITNTLVISVAERRRDLGILKALGTLRRQVISLVVLEALAIVGCGGLLGYGLGSYLIRYSAEAITSRNTGWVIPFSFPWAIASGLVPLLIVVTVAATVYPARLALAVSPAEALEFE